MALLADCPWKCLLPVETDGRATLDLKLSRLEQLQAVSMSAYNCAPHSVALKQELELDLFMLIRQLDPL